MWVCLLWNNSTRWKKQITAQISQLIIVYICIGVSIHLSYCVSCSLCTLSPPNFYRVTSASKLLSFFSASDLMCFTYFTKMGKLTFEIILLLVLNQIICVCESKKVSLWGFSFRDIVIFPKLVRKYRFYYF